MLCGILPALAVDEEDELSNPDRGLKLQFLPPPMEGTISLGVFDSSGKLVRTLAREADLENGSEFVKAVNGLVTWWDGKDDAGVVLPKGNYHVRGFSVGDLQVEGVSTHGNDWIEDDASPRVHRVKSLSVDARGSLGEEFELAASGTGASLAQKAEAAAVDAKPSITLTSTNGKLSVTGAGGTHEIALGEGESVLDAAPGFNNVAWVVVQTGSMREVRAYAADGDFLRRLQYAPGNPLPVSIKPSPTDNQIHLLEQNDREQRVRTLRLEAVSQPVATGTGSAPITSGSLSAPASTWRETFSKTIWFSETFAQVRDRLKFPDGTPFVPQEKIRVVLRLNEMEGSQPGAADLSVVVDEKGSHLQTADGLQLRTISDTPGLKWAVMGRPANSKLLVVFQSDGVAIEEFQIHRAADMMPFDLDTFSVDPAALGKK